MSQRQSCDRCRQQKVRCLRDEARRGGNIATSPGQSSFSRCERCTKAGADCVYSLKRSDRRPFQTSARRDTDAERRDLDGTSWFDQGLIGTLYPGGPALGADFSDLVGQFPGVDEGGAVVGWDPTSFNSLAGSSAVVVPTAPSSTEGPEDSEDVDDKDATDALSLQLTSLSQRATRATRHLGRPGHVPLLTVSSPEVKGALEDTNTLIRIIANMTAPGGDSMSLADSGLVFSALACHQHLVALFRAICDAIQRCLQSRKEHGDVGPSSVAHFVMVLQLLMHLINRMDRSLFHNTGLPTSSSITPVTPNVVNQHSIDVIEPSQGGLLILVQDIVVTIPIKHEKLRQVIQQLQTEMEMH